MLGTSRKQWLLCLTAMLVVSTSLVLWEGGAPTQAQTFDSGSNGSDGALNFTTPGTIIFDPQALGLDPDGDNVYHFTSITIGAGVTVSMSATYINGSVFWLASGPVQIDGTIDLSGEDGHPGSFTIISRHAPVPGPGGYTGGLGGNSRSDLNFPPLPGSGPGGGGITAGGGGHGRNTSNSFLVPLIGGSGGAGGNAQAHRSAVGPGGGAGGGAILIASSVSITVNGSIQAKGGQGGAISGTGTLGGSGAGGSIRLAASVLRGNGALAVSGAGDGNTAGFIRLEDFQRSSGMQTSSAHSHVFIASPFAVFPNPPPSPVPSVRVVSVAGMPVPPSPTGNLTMPDITISELTSVPLEIEARNIPPGTVVQLHIFSEANNGTGQVVNTTPLGGTMQLSTATATYTFPAGFSQGFVRATWTP